jgi:PadR family transcriptional regulator PadR
MQWVSSKWGQSDTGRRVRVYSLTKIGRKQLAKEEAQWQRSTGIIARFFNITEDPA